MDKEDKAKLLQYECELLKRIWQYGETEERLSQLRIVEKALRESDDG